MKTVVTGGTGFIGSHLVRRLLDEGREVIVVADFACLGLENLTDLGVGEQDIEVRKADLTDYKETLKALEGAEVVYHLAARVGSLQYLHGTDQAELHALQTNLRIDASVFRVCLERGIKRLIYASSCAVYSMERQFSPGAIFSESDLDLNSLAKGTQPILPARQTINPDGGYGWAKLIGEIQLHWMANIKKSEISGDGIDIGIARIFTVYGENEPLGERAHVIADLIQKAIRYPEKGLVVYGDGKQSRDFLYISDCIDALLKLEEAISTGQSLVMVNIGSGQATTIKTIAEKVVMLSGKGVEIKYDLGKPIGPVSRTADITKAQTLLRWGPKVSLDEGLRHTYAWVYKRLGEYAFIPF